MRAAEPVSPNVFWAMAAADELPDWDHHPADGWAEPEIKPADWGWIDGKIVRVDYGIQPLIDDTA